MHHKKIKVLQCIRQGQIGGGESHLLSLAENINRDKFEITVLSFTDGPMVSRLREMGITTHIIPTLKPFDIRIWGRVKSIILQEKFDIVHAHGTRAMSNVFWAAKSLKIPLVYTVHGWSFHPDQKAVIQKVRVWSERLLTSKADKNICVSASNKTSGQSFIKNLEAVVINNGIDQKKFDPQRAFPNLKALWGMPDDSLAILFLARFTFQKQPLLLIKAFKEAMAEFKGNVKLIMVGEGEERKAADALIEQLDLQHHITLLPFRSDVPDVLHNADLFVLPSLWEGLPIGLLEAMAMGKAIIASEVDGTSEVIKHQENGFLFEPGNVAELKSALISVVNDQDLRSQLQRNSMQTITNKYNVGQMTEQIAQLYTNLRPASL